MCLNSPGYTQNRVHVCMDFDGSVSSITCIISGDLQGKISKHCKKEGWHGWDFLRYTGQ